jgi:hypothetical protein
VRLFPPTRDEVCFAFCVVEIGKTKASIIQTIITNKGEN